MSDRTLDRVPRFDDRSRRFTIREVVGDRPLRGRGWQVPARLDQGSEGACVGFGWAHELSAVPVKAQVDNRSALLIYHAAQKIDEWEGESYSGTSVLAGAKVIQSLGHIGEYRWAFGLNDVLLALAYEGPVVLGLNWYTGMFEPDIKGLIHVTGDLEGGHCILAYGVSVAARTVQLHNSWGASWGLDGRCKITWEDLDRLLQEQGEACVPMLRKQVT